tara:strand:- start:900 stop:1223 length:324 start_codon:yes stop_codon:yes gene_type:complete
MAWQDNKEYVIRQHGCQTDNNGVIVQVRVRELDEVFGATDAQITAAYTRDRWEDVRIERDKLLAETDWRALQDTTTMPEAWTTYRQALRDITTQTDVDNLTWPTKPE